ncbi:hypothetical protein PCANC_26889 [Puccinia coronata f. sp. avenae]|uniref:Uncharacterized protein n=1 Tax=Puccinia coronata f. sp. avenae TaxID=200324 RepID=A0A2N5RW98_9BASI|nr:hypothetical protein PCANC_26889 [Puccinia coronata f. sp. avenae]PLW31044.1 hypothetical protein PCASD_16047 [Puccinia coronata f. sp. avenae]
MVHNDRLVVVSIIALLSTWFQDGSTRPLPAEEHSSMGSWLDYFQEVEAPEWPQYSEIPSEWHPYADMPIRSGPEPTQFHYADIPVPYPVNEHQSTGSSHGLDFQHITNTYHHPSSSHTVVDHHFNIPNYNTMLGQHINNVNDGTSPFTMSSIISEMHFGFISTSSFPAFNKLKFLREDDWGFKEISDRRSGLFNAPPTLSDNIQMARANLEALVEEIDTRNKQFLICFFALATEGTEDYLSQLKEHRSYQDMKAENAGLLEWLFSQLESVARLNDPHGSNVDSSLSPFQENLITFLKSDRQTTEQSQARWQCLKRPSRSPPLERANKKSKNPSTLITQASLAEASLTGMAIKAMGTYYKLVNSEKWHKLFVSDDNFFKIFFRMKVQQHHSNVDKHMAGELEELRVLPWKDKDQFDRNHEVKEIVKKFNKYIRVNLDMDKKFVEINPSSK